MLRQQDRARLDAAFEGYKPEVTTPDYEAFHIGDFQTMQGTWAEVLELDVKGKAVLPTDVALQMLIEARRSVMAKRKQPMLVNAIENAAFNMATNLPIVITEQFMERYND